MSESYRKINYNLRPSKHMERKMICEALRRLAAFGRVETYRYIGFGALYFSDFVLFHKSLGMRHMISVEHEKKNEESFEFNKPYDCITIKYGESNDILPQLPWDVRTVLWLDYDGRLDESVLRDIEYFANHGMPGSVIIVTVNAHPDPKDSDPIKTLREAVSGRKVVPSHLRKEDLQSWGLARVCAGIIRNDILEVLFDRSAPRQAGSKFCYKQLFNFHYSDGARMLTTGGIIYDEGQSGIVDGCSFDSLPFVVVGDDAFRIEVPKLTYREILYLDSQLPCADVDQLETFGIPRGDVESYRQLYRYFPRFAEAEF